MVHPDFHQVCPVFDVPLGPKLRYTYALDQLCAVLSRARVGIPIAVPVQHGDDDGDGDGDGSPAVVRARVSQAGQPPLEAVVGWLRRAARGVCEGRRRRRCGHWRGSG